MQKIQFKTNLEALLGAARKANGETLHSFSVRVLGPGPTEYKWLRKVLSEGSALKRAGTKNHDRLLKLHSALGLEWPRLWEQQPPKTLIERATRLLDSSKAHEFIDEFSQLLLRFEIQERMEEIISQLVNDYPYYWERLLRAHGENATRDWIKWQVRSDPETGVEQIAAQVGERLASEVRSRRSNAEAIVLQLSNEFSGSYEQLLNAFHGERDTVIDATAFHLITVPSGEAYYDVVLIAADQAAPTTEATPSSLEGVDKQVELTVALGIRNCNTSGVTRWKEFCDRFDSEQIARERLKTAWEKLSAEGVVTERTFPVWFWQHWRASREEPDF